MPSGSLRSAQTWSQGHLRSLASDAYAAALHDDSAESKLDIEEGGVSPWKGDKVSLQTGKSSQCSCPWIPSVVPSVAPNVAPSVAPGVAPIGDTWTSIAAPTLSVLVIAFPRGPC